MHDSSVAFLPTHGPLDLIWDMETNDPDDFLTLLWLLGRPDINLKAITVIPGSPHQIGLVRRALEWFGRSIPVGAFNLDHPKPCVSEWHYKAYGRVPPSFDAEPAAELLLQVCDQHTTLLTGAPLKNLGAALALAAQENCRFTLGRWVAQGGFAGDGVVPPERQLDKFKGRTTCATFNFGGDSRSALAALASPWIGTRRLVSKNVCHGVIYDQDLHRQVAPLVNDNLGLKLVWKGMDHYLRQTSSGKAFHDPLAACCAIDQAIGEWAEVEVYRERGEWGARLAPGSGTWIITGYRHERFVEVLLGKTGGC